MLLAGGTTWRVTVESHHDKSRQRAEQAAQLYSSSFNREGLMKIQDMASQLTLHPRVINVVSGSTLPDNDLIIEELIFARQIINAALIYLLDKNGTTVACTPYGENGQKTLTGENYAFRPYFTNTMQSGRPTTYIALGVTTGKRGIYQSAPIIRDGQKLGVTVVKIDLDHLDGLLAKYPYPVAFMDSSGIIFATNQNDWLFKVGRPIAETEIETIRQSKQYADQPLTILEFNLTSPMLTISGQNYDVIKSSTFLSGADMVIFSPYQTPFWQILAKSCLAAGAGGILVLMTYAIILRGRAKRELENQLAREHDLFMLGPAMIFKWRAKEGWPVEYASSNTEKILGYAPNDFLAGTPSYADIIHPDDLARVSNEVTHFSTKPQTSFQHQPYRLLSSNGTIIWVADYTTIFRDEQGIIKYYFGYVLDITKSQNLTELLSSEKHRSELFISATNLGTWEWNVQTGVLICNDRWAEIIGYTLEELDRTLTAQPHLFVKSTAAQHITALQVARPHSLFRSRRI